MSDKIKLIIGLGNPDLEYKKTYHDVGHLFLDYLETENFELKIKKILKTDVFMNKSGLFVKENLKKESVKPEELLIIHDDSDIELGKFKLSFGRNSAGHRGVQNIINQLKTNKFWRLRIGIRPAKNKDKADQLVLKKITPVKLVILEKVFKEIVVALKF